MSPPPDVQNGNMLVFCVVFLSLSEFLKVLGRISSYPSDPKQSWPCLQKSIRRRKCPYVQKVTNVFSEVGQTSKISWTCLRKSVRRPKYPERVCRIPSDIQNVLNVFAEVRQTSECPERVFRGSVRRPGIPERVCGSPRSPPPRWHDTCPSPFWSVASAATPPLRAGDESAKRATDIIKTSSVPHIITASDVLGNI